MATDVIMNLGDDQLANQFLVIFPSGIPGGGNADNVCLRMDMQFDPPEDTINVYEIFYRGLKIPKTGMLHETSKEFTTDVRLDQQWAVFDDLNAWFKKCYDPVNGTALSDLMTRTTMLIQALDGSQTAQHTIRFVGVKIKSIKVQTFDNASGDPLRLTLGFIYVDMIHE